VVIFTAHDVSTNLSSDKSTRASRTVIDDAQSARHALALRHAVSVFKLHEKKYDRIRETTSHR